jgi:serine protease SohB
LEFLTEYGLFLAKIVTFVVAALVVISVVMSAAQKDRGDHEGEGELKIRKLNEKYEKLREPSQSRLMSDQQRKLFQKARKKEQKAEKMAAKAQER